LKRGAAVKKAERGNPLQTFLTFNDTSFSRIFEARKTTPELCSKNRQNPRVGLPRRSGYESWPNIPVINCSFQASRVDEKALSPQVQQDLLRIAQEAISNALRHAQPSEIKVSLRGNQSNLILRVTDNGSGLARTRPLSEGHGFGFANMCARAKNLGALETVVVETPRTAATGLWLTGVPIWMERNRNESCRQTTALTKTRRE
jgi:anti-sigma regulatory factor (Ser/Thr protein kinase)